MLIPVIMAGGTGSRLWPMSREHFPKQFLRLSSQHSMLQETIERLKGLDCVEPILICNEKHRFLAAEQLRQIGQVSNNIILEPVGRNTAPAIALAALEALSNYTDPVILVLAADHVIENIEFFHKAINNAKPFADNGKLVTFGIVATTPETGYGYIQRGENLERGNAGYSVKRFVEKPDAETAEEYIKSGEYYWNSGMFLFKASRYIEELGKFRPDILDACEKCMENVHKDTFQDFIRIDKDIFSQCSAESIDYAVMEKTEDAVVIPLDAGWSDVGSWSALWEINAKDSSNNTLSGDIYVHNTNDCYINTDETFVAAIGVTNLVIVNTKDALLVIDKSQVQDVKKAVEYLKLDGRREYKLHRESYRPWGRHDKIVEKPRYHVNRVTVKPGGKFSLQKHLHRAEHWVVLSGTAEVTLEDKVFLLTENQSTFIPVGATHMLVNPGKIPLELLEIESGSYLAEDDIIRIKDHYGHF
ncbi:mannose-1-phosphate guanylyltransferase/mannose-6-phosphate isomerase [Klebsiella oxytoca]|uniref:mannose-1-phosphate guanylyltransferase/mannose-6-phosphate isomerase n=1 Tax=Klebsiella oxytoca TaxID=571 RepID=UPI0039C955EC|nr:mannose-1-phosphate guanylyltransferase/mannose-6-phosphate isomerase [Klebsiella oxytoca]